mmetsp:Transcript_12566/g.38408  ORF Transcript_12566/g.38408 Transcript_12566/m.38408 type:complete len:270 (+) Transcript_12566:190-999(+)
MQLIGRLGAAAPNILRRSSLNLSGASRGLGPASGVGVLPRRALHNSSVQGSATAEDARRRNRNVSMWMVSVAVGVLGLSYAAVPLYRMFCQVTGIGGTVQESISGFGFSTPTDQTQIVADARPLRITFNSDVSTNLRWSFRPEVSGLVVRPGETTLAFYKAKNKMSQPITGVATYNVQPPKAGIYFNKIQCFCFEEQQLKANEEVDMPVFFFIDPEFADDPRMADVTEIMLSYTFFRAEDIDTSELERQQQAILEGREQAIKLAATLKD